MFRSSIIINYNNYCCPVFKFEQDIVRQYKLKERARLLLQTAACCKTADSFRNYLSSAVWIMYRSCLLRLVDSVFSGLCQRNWTLFCPTGLHCRQYTNNLFRSILYLQVAPRRWEIMGFLIVRVYNLTPINLNQLFENGGRKECYLSHIHTSFTLNSFWNRQKLLFHQFFFSKASPIWYSARHKRAIKIVRFWAFDNTKFVVVFKIKKNWVTWLNT